MCVAGIFCTRWLRVQWLAGATLAPNLEAIFHHLLSGYYLNVAPNLSLSLLAGVPLGARQNRGNQKQSGPLRVILSRSDSFLPQQRLSNAVCRLQMS